MLRPFFTYYGGKFRAVPHYPAPRYDQIVEPFAGSAGYATRYADHNVYLVEKNPKVAAVWRYLLAATPDMIAALPLVGDGWETTDDLVGEIPEGARYLIGFWLNKGVASPRKSPSRWLRDGEGGTGANYWGPAIRERIASQVTAVRHWRLIEGDYTAAPGLAATWFIDPPYAVAGGHYPNGAAAIDYMALAAWSRSRRGQVLVCEAEGADWLPFQPLAEIKATSGRGRTGTSREVIWRSDMCEHCRHPEHGAKLDGTGPACNVAVACDDCPDSHACACPNW